MEMFNTFLNLFAFKVSRFDLRIKYFFGIVQNYRDEPVSIKLSGSDEK
jgi:hypothetical protein